MSDMTLGHWWSVGDYNIDGGVRRLLDDLATWNPADAEVLIEELLKNGGDYDDLSLWHETMDCLNEYVPEGYWVGIRNESVGCWPIMEGEDVD